MKKWMKALALVLSAALLTGLAACGTQGETKDKETDAKVYKIGVIQLVEHPSLDAAREGFIERMNELGVHYEVDFQNAQNDASSLKSIAQRFVNNNVDLVLAIATPAVQSMLQESSSIPILGTAVTDYVEVNLVDSNEKPGGNVSGTSDATPLKEQLGLIEVLAPGAKTVGLLYTASEPNSQIQITQAKEMLDEMGLAYKDYAITSSNDIQQMMQTMDGQVDVVYTPTDNTVASAMSTVAQASIDYKIPVITGSTDMALDGGTATYGLNYRSLGRQTADMAERVLVKGEDIAAMPVEKSNSFDFVYNEDIVKSLEIEIPQELVHKEEG